MPDLKSKHVSPFHGRKGQGLIKRVDMLGMVVFVFSPRTQETEAGIGNLSI
jgi:hypothetical protein